MTEPKRKQPIDKTEPSSFQVRGLDPQLKREINAYAKLHGITLADVVTEAFKLLVAKKD